MWVSNSLNPHFLKSNEESQLMSVVGESLWEWMRSKGVVVSGVTTAPVGVVRVQVDTGVRRDLTGSHQHLRSDAAPTLYRGVDPCWRHPPHTRVVQIHGVETRAFCSNRWVSVVASESVLALTLYTCAYGVKLVCITYINKSAKIISDSSNYKPQLFSLLYYFRNSFIHSFIFKKRKNLF